MCCTTSTESSAIGFAPAVRCRATRRGNDRRPVHEPCTAVDRGSVHAFGQQAPPIPERSERERRLDAEFAAGGRPGSRSRAASSRRGVLPALSHRWYRRRSRWTMTCVCPVVTSVPVSVRRSARHCSMSAALRDAVGCGECIRMQSVGK